MRPDWERMPIGWRRPFHSHERISARSLPLEAIALTLLAMCVCGRAAAQCKPENVPEIIQRATAAMQSDWNAFPGFAFVERDSETSKGVTVVNTNRVFMIEGTDYYMPIAVNDKPYTPEQLAQEHKRLLEEIDRRSHETAKEREHRSDRYWKERNQTGILLEQYVKAFDFKLAGEETINGHLACVLARSSTSNRRATGHGIP